MTARNLYEGILIELNKDNAPNILLEDFNYFANKAINQYINKRYNIYDVNQQTTDDLRVLKATAMLIPKKVDDYDGLTLADGGMATYYVDLPSDYLHLLNCICIYNVKKTYKCYNAGDTWRAAATRLTADAYSQVLDNFWFKPSYKKPYYYIHNINNRTDVPTNPYENVEYIYTLPEDKTTTEDLFDGTKLETKVTYTRGNNFGSTGICTKTVTITNYRMDNGQRIVIGSVTTYTTEERVFPTTRSIGGNGTDSLILEPNGTDANGIDIVQGTNNPGSIDLNGMVISSVERG